MSDTRRQIFHDSVNSPAGYIPLMRKGFYLVMIESRQWWLYNIVNVLNFTGLFNKQFFKTVH